MRPQEIIAKKRDGNSLTAAEIHSFVSGVCDGSWADYQISALLMAIFTRGMGEVEQTILTQEMLRSGDILDFSDIDAPKADKHSTGGVGDKTSLIIAPLAAACGVAVPMISGRGLGHTGGTLDKLESIKGYTVNLTLSQFRGIIKKCGFSMIGQTDRIAPADKKIYSLRDATATVGYVPLIVASIMSKKLAEGLDALVLDVKTGSGAFMETLEDAESLAAALVGTGQSCGVLTEAVISDMSQPLGKYVGNALEVFECIQILRGESDRLMDSTLELSIALTSRILVSTGIAHSIDSARVECLSKIQSGAALEKFRQNIELQGGDPEVCDHPRILFPDGIAKFEIAAERDGFVSAIDTKSIGDAVVELGGGRTKIDDVIDCAVGVQCERRIGDEVREGEPLAILFGRDENQMRYVGTKLGSAFKIGPTKAEKPQLIQKIIS